ncbi:MAG: glycosyltransferase family 2 protein [Pseudomonadota bacterium]
MTAPLLTIVIPAFNEAASIADVVREAIEVVGAEQPAFEIIVIDDGSDDDTAGALSALAANEPRLLVIRHQNRSGKSAALRTGMLNARSKWVATMDGDGQDDPRYVLEMAGLVDLGAVKEIGVVAGCRANRTDGASRKFASRFANGLRRALLNDDCPDTACGLKLVARDVFLALPFFDALHRYIPALSGHLGFATLNHRVVNRERSAGQSKYSNIGRAVAGLFDLLGVIWLMRRTHAPGRAQLMRDSARGQGEQA